MLIRRAAMVKPIGKHSQMEPPDSMMRPILIETPSHAEQRDGVAEVEERQPPQLSKANRLVAIHLSFNESRRDELVSAA